nr:AsmA family protein [Acetobacter persici]
MTSAGQDLPRPLHKRALRVLTVLAAAVLVLPVLCVAALLVRMLFGPVNVTPVVRPFLPVAVLNGQPGQPAAATLTLRRAELQWNGLRDGLSVPVMLSLHDVRILKADRTTADTIKAAHVTLDPLALMHGSIALNTVDLTGVRMALRRGTDGTVGLDVDAPPAPATASDTNGSLDPSALHRIGLTDAQVTIDDRLTHTQWIASPITSTLRAVSLRGGNGLTGSVALTFQAQQDSTERLSITRRAHRLIRAPSSGTWLWPLCARKHSPVWPWP